MDQAIIEGNCGQLCNYHCCRSHEADDSLGMYLLPKEYQAVQADLDVAYEVHSSYQYELPKGIKKQYYIFCHNNSGCLRDNRPIQCRTYPLEAHYIEGELQLVIENDQLHACPLLNDTGNWRKEFLLGIYKGWQLLLEIEKIKSYISELSLIREKNGNIYKRFDKETIFNL